MVWRRQARALPGYLRDSTAPSDAVTAPGLDLRYRRHRYHQHRVTY